MSDNDYTQPRKVNPDGVSELGDENSFMKFMLSDEAKIARKEYKKDQERLILEGATSGPAERPKD